LLRAGKKNITGLRFAVLRQFCKFLTVLPFVVQTKFQINSRLSEKPLTSPEFHPEKSYKTFL